MTVVCYSEQREGECFLSLESQAVQKCNLRSNLVALFFFLLLLVVRYYSRQFVCHSCEENIIFVGIIMGVIAKIKNLDICYVLHKYLLEHLQESISICSMKVLFPKTLP